MKRVLSFILTVCLLATITPFSFAVSAEDDLYDQFEGIYLYNVYDGEACITGTLEEPTGSITIPETLGGYPVKGIESYAFNYNGELISVTIPASVTYIGYGVFGGCTALESITVEAGNPVYHSAGNCVIDTESKRLVVGCGTSVIPTDGSVTYIGEYSFESFSFESISLPEGIKKIGSAAFQGCEELESVNIPASVTYIGDWAFANCHMLSEVNFGNTENWRVGGTTKVSTEDLANAETAARFLTADYKQMYWEVAETFSYIIENDEAMITEVDSFVSGDVVIPDELDGYPVTGISDSAFNSLDQITSITIPASVTYIGENGPFYGCDVLQTITVAESNPVYHSAGNCLIETETGLLVAGTNTSVIPTDGSVEMIGSYAFGGLVELESIEIPEGITYIEFNAFANCTALKSITFPASAEKIGEGVVSGCDFIESITVAEGNPVYHSAGNCIIKTETKELVVGCNVSVIPTDGSVESIATEAFRYCEGLTSIDIPDSVTYISSYVFSGCSDLESVKLPAQLEVLGNGAFESCSSLTEITIPGTVNRIGYEAFAWCSALESVSLSANTQRIDSRAFYQCYSLESINIPETVNYIGNYAFSNCWSLDEVIFEKTEDWSADETELLSADLENAETAADYLTSTYSSCEWIIKDESNAFTHEIVEGEAFITGVQSWVEGDVTIPAELDGYPVTHIAWNAFGGNESITSITIPDSVEYIEDYAFSECTALESIDLGGGLKYIGSNAFSGCPLLESVHIPASTEQISWSLFGGCTNLESLTVDEANPVYHSAGNCIIETESGTLVAGCDKSVIPADGSVEIIGRGAFEYCENLESVTIPASVSIIDEYAFDGCEALESVSISEGLEEIGYGAFYDCSSLESIDIPASVTYIGGEVFSGCYNLSEITVDEDNTVYHSAGNCLIDTETKTLIAGCYTSVIPDDGSVETIGTEAFSGCIFLESIEIPEGVTMIDYSAFSNCISLESISLPRSLKYIESDAFAYCQYLESITIPAGVEYIGSDAFYGCESLTAVYFESPEDWRVEYEDTVIEGLDDAETAADYLTSEDNYYGIEKIVLYRYEVEDGGAIIFQADKSLSGDVVVPDELGGYPVTGIYYGAFEMREEITSIELPDSITYIGEDAFWGCSALESIKLPASLEYIDTNAFRNCEALESIHIPAGVEFIGEYAFSGCAALESITVDEDNTVYHSEGNCLIDTEAKLLIMGCNTSVIPADGSVEIIGDGAFAGCEEIESITIPESVTEIGYGAFMECRSLTSLHIPSSVTYIGEAPTVYCTNLESITVDEDNTAYHSKDNCLIETETGTIVAGCNTSIIPADGSITAIGTGAFAGCEALTDIELPEGVEFIGYGAFSECPNLESISLPESLTVIDEYAFAWCKSLVSIEIPEGITEIGNDTFYYCSALESVKLPESLESIGSYAFSDCTSLTSIRIPANVTKIGYRAFDWCENLTEVIFENPEGWFFMGEDVGEYLADPEIAAEALTNLYDNLVKYEKGNVDGEDGITASDAIYLLYHVFFGEGRYPVNQTCDFDGNGEVEAADAIYLLYHVFFGEDRYPLS